MVAPEIEALDDDDDDDEDDHDDDEDEKESNEEDDDDEEEDYELGINDLDEKDRPALLNLILGELLKKFRAENGRGPDSEELLGIRRRLADRLGVHLEESTLPKRQADEGDSDCEKHEPSPKRVKFTGEDGDEAAGGGDSEDDDAKPAASSSSKREGDKKQAATE